MKKSLAGVLTGSLLFIGTTLSVAADNHDGDKDCGDFATHEEVMAFWYENGYNAENDPHDLDRDNDGLACEVSQAEYDEYVASQTADDSEDNQEEAADDQGEAAEDQEESDDEQENATDDQEEAVEEDEEEGAALPDTASNGPLMMLFGAGLAGAGSLLLFRRKTKSV